MWWSRRDLMVKFSVVYSVAGGRALPCRGMVPAALLAPRTTRILSPRSVGVGASAHSIQTTAASGRCVVGSSRKPDDWCRYSPPHTTAVSIRGLAAPTTTMNSARWPTGRAGAHSPRLVTTAPHGVEVEHVPSQQRQQQQQQPEDSPLVDNTMGSPATTTTAAADAATAAEATSVKEFVKPAPAFRPDRKRMLRIPEEEWPSYPNFSFAVESECKTGTKARTGTITTPHGAVQTPAFIFCATKAAIKGLSVETMKECGSQIILSNTYHLHVQPGGDLIEKMGGLQKATRWEGPMLTDSGGYQIFSMGHGSVGDEIKGRRGAKGKSDFEPSLVSIGEKGARFKSYFDCSVKALTPELSIKIQRQLGADLVVVLDECTPFHVDKEYTESSMHRTHRWAMRSLREFIDGDTGAQALYGIIQGGVYPDLRDEAVDFVNRMPFFGIAVGGSLGSDKATMHQVVAQTMTNVRRDRPVHLLGIGGIADIFHGVRQGIDTFDCVHPTRLGRHGGALVKASFWEDELQREREAEQHAATAVRNEMAFSDGSQAETGELGPDWAEMRRRNKKRGRTSRGKLPPVVPNEHVNLLKGRYKDDHRVIDKDCGCPTCKGGYTRAYINHLGKAGELLGGMLVLQHNVYFMNELMTSIRKAIREGTLDAEEDKWLAPGLRSRDIHRRAAEAARM